MAALQTKQTNLTMPQLKKLRQTSKSIKRSMERTSTNAPNYGDIEPEFSAYNPGFLCDDLETKDTSNFETLESNRNTEVSSKGASELRWKINSSAIAGRRSRSSQTEASVTSRDRPESPQIIFKDNNNEEIYQLRECAATESQVWVGNDAFMYIFFVAK